MKKRTTKISTSDFPTDLLVEILSRLPFKSFYRFKTVSKSWLSLSLDPYYRKKLPQPPSALIYESLDPISNKRGIHSVQLNSSAQSTVDTPFGFLPHFERTEILDYCNGLFLCFCSNYSPNIKRLFVCNPANSRYFALPFPTNFDYKFVLAFDPHVSSHFHVLKFEETKIDWETSLVTGLTVFSSYSTNWVERKISLRVEFEFARTPSAFHNGVVYKLVNKAILAIKFEDLSMELIPLPIQATSGWYGRIGISERSLVYMVKKEEEILIWSLIGTNENKEWIVKYRLSITKIFGSDAFFFRHYPRLISFHPEQGVVFFTGANEVNKIFSFDCSNGEMCDIFSLESKIVIQSFFYVSCYVDCISANN